MLGRKREREKVKETKQIENWFLHLCDSGGPLLCRDVNDRERFYVAGIVSWGVKCANPKLPGVYANVLKYLPWVKKNINHFSNQPPLFTSITARRHKNNYEHRNIWDDTNEPIYG